MPDLPVHFLTIVQNGEPFIRYHIDVLSRLPFRWHWHIVEGVADLKHDTAWALHYGGKIADSLHENGLSNDGTTAYLDRLAELHPGNITLYRPQPGRFWDGKREMVNAPLPSIKEECLLWQIDADEFWTCEQLIEGQRLFAENPQKTSAWYFCHFFVGTDLVVQDDAASKHRLNAGWLRSWRYTPGCRWDAHEPPLLVRPGPGGTSQELGTANPFYCEETRNRGLVFQHKAYVLPKQLRFKELYYGYSGATANWLLLQNQRALPVLLKPFFPWPFIADDTQAINVDMAGFDSIPLPHQGEGMVDIPRDISRLERFLESLASDVYPQEPSFTQSDITSKALDLLCKLFLLKPGMKVLDVGCGQGPALEFFRDCGTDYLGVTLGDDDIAACRAKEFRVEKMDQSFLAVDDNSQDLLWARHVIEHSVFPLFTLHEFNRVLRPGGFLYLEVPAPETACNHERNPNHYSVLTKGSWKSLIERSGFLIVADVDYSFEVPAGPDTYWGFYCVKNRSMSE